jgi:hypothetical protein
MNLFVWNLDLEMELSHVNEMRNEMRNDTLELNVVLFIIMIFYEMRVREAITKFICFF